MRQVLQTTLAAGSTALCAMVCLLWVRSYRQTDFWPLVVSTAGGPRLVQPTSWRGGLGLKVTDGWPLWTSRRPLWERPPALFGDAVASDERVGLARVVRGTDLFVLGGRMDPRPGVAVLVPHAAVAAGLAMLPALAIRRWWAQRRARAGPAFEVVRR